MEHAGSVEQSESEFKFEWKSRLCTVIEDHDAIAFV